MYHAQDWLAAGRRAARANGPGVAVSLALHGLLALLVLVVVVRHTTGNLLPQPVPVPVDIIRLGDETRSPPAERHALVPQQKAGKPQTAASPVLRAVSPTAAKPAPDDALAAKLKALARLKQPDSPLKFGEGAGVADSDAGGGPPGDRATYAVRDYVLAQVLRHWTVDLTRARPIAVRIAVTMKRDGTISEAAIVEQARAKTDAVYRDVAIGARNAVFLSSPVVLPPGDYPKEMRFTLVLDTRAVVR